MFVSSDEVLPVPGVLNCGVLERSILEPIILLYVNDLPKALTKTGTLTGTLRTLTSLANIKIFEN